MHEELEGGGVNAEGAEEEGAGAGISDGPAGEAVDPEAAAVEGGMGGGVGSEGAGNDVPGCKAGGMKGVVDSLAGEGFHDAGSVADVGDAVQEGADGGALEWGDGVPLQGCREVEAGANGGAQGGEVGGGGYETEIGEAVAYGGGAAVALGEEVELDAVAEVGRSGGV